VILHDTPKAGCAVVENRIKDQFCQHRFAAGRKTSKTNLALGTASYPDEGNSGEELLKKVTF
jgi:hypothetical protein